MGVPLKWSAVRLANLQKHLIFGPQSGLVPGQSFLPGTFDDSRYPLSQTMWLPYPCRGKSTSLETLRFAPWTSILWSCPGQIARSITMLGRLCQGARLQNVVGTKDYVELRISSRKSLRLFPEFEAVFSCGSEKSAQFPTKIHQAASAGGSKFLFCRFWWLDCLKGGPGEGWASAGRGRARNGRGTGEERARPGEDGSARVWEGEGEKHSCLEGMKA